ncbi:fimb protein, partial [Neisseria sp. P0001.S006]
LYSVSLARPVVSAFVTDRMNVVTAAEIDVNDLSHAPKDLEDLSWFGARRVGLREATSPDEAKQSLDLSLKGIEPSMR